MEFQGFDADALDMATIYKLMVNAIAPRPIAFVSSLSADGVANLAPFSYFMAGGANPPSVVISPTTNRDGTFKDTLRNIIETEEFVINVVTYAMRERMNHTAANYPYGVSEWEPAGFEPAPSVKVRPAHVADSPIAMECRLHTVVPHGDGPLSANYVIGEVVYFHVARDIINDGVIDALKVDYIGRLGGDWYSRAHEEALFEMPRPPKF